jgi:Flp pilus assembly protein TadG
MLLPILMFLSRFKRATGGVTAIEFSLVAVPFFFLMFAIIDVSMISFASSMLENGVATASRQIRTGKVQSTNMTPAQFRTLICNEISMLLACDARLGIDVRKYSGFSDAEFEPALDGNGNMTGQMNFDPGTAGDVVIVRAFYTWSMLTPSIGPLFTNMSGNHRLLEASTAFRNEPFGSILAN